MLIIDRRHVIVHMKKCGGHSFCEGLMRTLDPERYYSLGYGRDKHGKPAPISDGALWKHATAMEIRQHSGDRLEDDATFYLLADRPIVDRLASYYKFGKRQFERGFSAYSRFDTMTFSEFLRQENLDIGTIPEFACDTDGEIIVDYLISFDSLEADFKSVLKNIFGDQAPECKFPKANTNPNSENYAELYSESDIEFVGNKFLKEREWLRIHQSRLRLPH